MSGHRDIYLSAVVYMHLQRAPRSVCAFPKHTLPNVLKATAQLPWYSSRSHRPFSVQEAHSAGFSLLVRCLTFLFVSSETVKSTQGHLVARPLHTPQTSQKVLSQRVRFNPRPRVYCRALEQLKCSMQVWHDQHAAHPLSAPPLAPPAAHAYHASDVSVSGTTSSMQFALVGGALAGLLLLLAIARACFFFWRREVRCLPIP